MAATNLNCQAGTHEGNLRNLFGGVAPTVDVPLCLADTGPGGLGAAVQQFGEAFADDPGEFFEQWGTGIGTTTLQTVIGAAEFVIPAIASGGSSIPLQIATYVATHADPELSDEFAIINAANTVLSGGADMAWEDLFTDFGMDTLMDFGSSLIEEIDFGTVLDIGTDALSQFVSNPATPTVRTVSAGSVPGAVVRGAAGAIARVGPTVGRSFFNKWPNLATAIQTLRNAGKNVSRSKLYSMMKRFGPEFMVSAGILSAAAVSELIMAGPGHRRMNVGNVKALRRGMRRIESFHKLCTKADMLRSRGKRHKKAC